MFGAVSAKAQGKSEVVEEIIVRVNNEIITREDLKRARASLESEVREGCRGCAPEELNQRLESAGKDLLRDLIDQSLMAQRGKDMGLSVDTEVIRRLDAIRQENKIPSMEALEQEVTKSGQDFEDFKSRIRDQLLTQEVIRREVGSRIIISHEEIVKYYEEHKQEFVRPDMVVLREIFVSTEGKPAAEIPALRTKADGLRERVIKNGDDFGELAKRFSDSPTAQQGGELGAFERSRLDSRIADQVFALNRGQMTAVIETGTGFEILQVRERYEAGQQPLEKVENEVSSKIYDQRVGPAMRSYLTDLRADSYLQIKPGYADSATVQSAPIEEITSAPPEEETKKSGGRRLLIFPKKKSGT